MEEKFIYALGCFDGVHLGHSALLQTCRQLATEHRCRWGVVTFADHPDALLRGKAPGLINTPQDRERLLLQHQAELVRTLPFDEKLMAMPWQAFLSMLAQEHQAAGFVCGSDFRFGCGGRGDARLLQEYCREQGLVSQAVAQQELEGIRISSTHIRSLLEKGMLPEANRFLGHPHTLSGTVIAGKQLGRTVGIPTANLSYPPQLLQLPYGVYACRAEVEGKRYTALTNIGVRPTISGKGVSVESFLLDFSGDLYGKRITLNFYDFVRPERVFSSLTDLAKQIQKDKILVENIMKIY